MTQEQLESELAKLHRRERLLTQVRSGDVKLKRVLVTRKKKSWTVHARVKSYYREIAPAGWRP